MALLIVPYRQIAQVVAERVVASRDAADPLRAWGVEVIVPSRGMAEAIAAAVVARVPEGIASLQIRFLDELARTLVNGAGWFPRVAPDAERRLAMRMAVRMQMRTGDHPMMEGRGIASMLERSYRDVRDSGLTLADITPRRGLRNVDRTRAIVRAFGEYERLIASWKATDAAEVLARAERHASNARPQILAGFYDMTGAQLRLVKALIAANKIIEVLAPTDLPFAQPFLRSSSEFLGVPRSSSEAEPTPRDSEEPRNSEELLLVHDTRDAELRHVCARVAELLASGVDAGDIGITARSFEPYDVRLLNRFASEHGFRTTLPHETPLIAHRIGRGAVTLLRLRERGFPRGEVLELLRDGLRVRTHIDADRADYETRRARIAGGTSEELAAVRRRSAVLADYVALVSELEALPLDFASLGSLFRIDTPQDLEAAAALDDLATLFARAKSNDVASFIDAIEHVTLYRQPTTADHPRIWAGDVMRFRGRSFGHLFVVRMQDDVFPQRRTEDPLFPDADRRLLGIREIGDGRAEEELLMQLVNESARNIHLSHATGDGFGKVVRPSRFVRNTKHETPNTKPSTLNLQPSTRQLQLLAKAGTRSAFDGYLPHLPIPLAAVSPTQLEDFGECPQKFLWKHILAVHDVEHPERELQIHHRDKGTIDHRILERFYRSGERSFERLEMLVDDAFAEHESEVPPFNRTVREIERRATKRILTEFVTHDLEDLDEQQLTPRYFEYRFGAKHRERADHAEPFVVEAGGVPVRVEGTIDRIDGDGRRFRIVDYKSGKALRHAGLAEKIDRGVRLQLALYAMAAADFFGADPANVSATIKPIAGVDGKGKFAFELHQKRAALLETLEIFVASILRGVFPAFPNDNDSDFNSCKYCPVNHSCRTRHDQEEVRAVQRHHDPRTLLRGGA